MLTYGLHLEGEEVQEEKAVSSKWWCHLIVKVNKVRIGWKNMIWHHESQEFKRKGNVGDDEAPTQQAVCQMTTAQGFGVPEVPKTLIT